MKEEFNKEIFNKDYTDLSALDKLEMQDFFVDEEEFLNLKNLYVDTAHYKVITNVKPKVETKESLDFLFTQKSLEKAPIWYNSVFVTLYPKEKSFVKRPLVQIAALLILAIILIPMLNFPTGNQNNRIVENELKQKESELIENSNKGNLESTTETENNVSSSTENSSNANSESLVMPYADANSKTDESSSDKKLAERSTNEFPRAEMASFGLSADLNPSMDDALASRSATTMSISASDQAMVLDLLTATF